MRDQKHKCDKCGRNDVRLYRWYGMFMRDDGDSVYCRACAAPGRIEGGNLVPLVEDSEGDVWGYTSVTDDDWTVFLSRPDA